METDDVTLLPMLLLLLMMMMMTMRWLKSKSYISVCAAFPLGSGGQGVGHKIPPGQKAPQPSRQNKLLLFGCQLLPVGLFVLSRQIC